MSPFVCPKNTGNKAPYIYFFYLQCAKKNTFSVIDLLLKHTHGRTTLKVPNKASPNQIENCSRVS